MEVKNLCKKLGNPQENLDCISVVGTNGKYSTIQTLKAILNEAKINCNIYTSPHIQKINERFIYNDNEIREILEKINDKESRILANTEREVLKILEGDCDTAIGIFSNINGNNISLTAELFSIDGNHRYFVQNTKGILIKSSRRAANS